ncbi:MAG: mechanosensitive ion channel family protein [Spirochaetales bacterium]|nr:mechanosensitive ion channel family protein [Spirochaetales bacterium]
MSIKWNKRKTLIVVMWLLTVLVSCLFFYLIEGAIFTNVAKTELLEQADIVANHIPTIVQNNYYADIGSLKILFSKLEASAFKLADYETIDEAKEFLDDISVSCGVSNLVVLDRNANLLYGTPEEAEELGLDAERICQMLDNDEFEKTAGNLKGIVNYEDFLTHYYLTEGSMKAADDSFFWGVEKKWIIAFSNARPQAEIDVRNYFDWRNVLQRIAIGNSGFLVAIKSDDGSILSSPDGSLRGKSLKLLGLNVKGHGEIQTAEDLLNAFPMDDLVLNISSNGVKYYATRLALEDAVVLALLPKEEVESAIRGVVSMSSVLLALFTGLMAIYAIIYLDDRYERGTGWNRLLANRLKIASIITVSSILFLSAYLSSLASYADLFRFSRTKVNNVVDILDKNEKSIDELKEWFDEEYLTRAKIVRSVLNHTEEERITQEYIAELCKLMEVSYIYVIDENGDIVVTNSRYDKFKVDANSPFYPILEGKPELVFSSEYDNLMGETLAKVGVSLIETHKQEGGMILVFANPYESQEIGKNLGYKSAFKKVSMTDDSVLMVIDSDTLNILYMATDINGELVPGDGSFNYTGLRVSSIGLQENKLRDNFNGNLKVGDRNYFASVKRSGNRFFLVMRPLEVSLMQNVIPILIVVLAALTFCIALILIACRKYKIKDLDKETGLGFDRISERYSNAKMVLTLGEILSKKKPFFEERWPNDCKKWKDKSAEEKFPILTKIFLLFAVAEIAGYAWLVGSDSIWYYCFNGEWGTGVNLYTISSCMLWICVLIIAKMVLHKILFLIAKVATPRGETICNLLDSYMAYILPVVGFFVCLANFGINTKALTLTGGAVGVIFGIGCQTIVADILSGFIMVLEGLVHNGDRVKLPADAKIVLGSADGPGKMEPVSIVQNVGIRNILLKKTVGVQVVRNNEFRNYILMSKNAEQSAIVEIAKILEKEVEEKSIIVDKEVEKAMKTDGHPPIVPAFEAPKSVETAAEVPTDDEPKADSPKAPRRKRINGILPNGKSEKRTKSNNPKRDTK